MIDKIRKFEKMVVFSLVVMMSLVLLLATVELAWIILKDIVTPPMFLLEVEELLGIAAIILALYPGYYLIRRHDGRKVGGTD